MVDSVHQQLKHQRFYKSFRLRTKADFSSMRKGKRINSGGIRLVCQANRLGFSRLGLAVSRKYGNAVERNRFKRQLRHSFRTGDYHALSVDVLVIPIQGANQQQHVVHDFQRAMGRLQT